MTMEYRGLYVSATPANFELEKSEGVIVEQLIRPTGLLDPNIEVRPSHNQIDDLMIDSRASIEGQYESFSNCGKK